MLDELKHSISEKSDKYEVHLTVVLLVVALILVGVACFGKPEHKAIATIIVCL